jgi:aryl sulfotransferase
VSYAHHRGRDVEWTIAFMADETTALAAEAGLMKAQLPQPLGSWSSHAASWHEQNDVPVLTVRYEDLLSDPVHHLMAVATRLGMTSDPGAAASAVAATRFDILRGQEQASGFVERRPGSSAPFFREGRAGGWRVRLAPSQADRIVDAHREVMARFGYV